MFIHFLDIWKNTMGSYNSCLMGKSHFPRIFNKLPKMVKNHPYLSCLDHLSVPHFSVFILLSLEPPLFIICSMVNLSQSQFVMLKTPCVPLFLLFSMIVPWLFHGVYIIFSWLNPQTPDFSGKITPPRSWRRSGAPHHARAWQRPRPSLQWVGLPVKVR